jgi:hypothetical protein
MDTKAICPICGTKPKVCDVGFLENVVCEHHIECERCGYSFDYEYGATRVSFCGLEWTWSYLMASNDRLAFNESMLAQKAYSEFWIVVNELNRNHDRTLAAYMKGKSQNVQ